MKKLNRPTRTLFAVAALIFAAATAFAYAQTSPRITVSISGNTIGLYPGDTFTATIGITENPGFAAMVLRMRIPAGLELIDATAHSLHDMYYGFELPACANDTPPSQTAPLHGEVFFGWTGRSRNFYANGAMFDLTFRVTETAAAGTAPVLLAFANGMGAYELPTDYLRREVQIALPGGVIGIGRSAEIARAIFPGLFVDASPQNLTIVNLPQNGATFQIFAGGLPPNQVLDPVNSPYINIDWQPPLPPWIQVSGHIETDANGTGVGTLTLSILE